jgi:hypothetical protein
MSEFAEMSLAGQLAKKLAANQREGANHVLVQEKAASPTYAAGSLL